jgi:hypothetical protein
MGILKRLVDLLAPLGFLLAVGALAWARAGRPLPGGLRPYLVGALALVLLHLVLRWEDVLSGIGRRQLKYGTNTLVLALAVLGILFLVNLLVFRNTKRFDLTKDQRYSLSDQTRKVMAGLQDEVRITYFQRQRDMPRGQDRLKEYQALSPKLKVEFVDPVQSPARAQAHDVRGPWPILVVEQGDRRERISSDGEQDITNAIIKIGREGPQDRLPPRGRGRAIRRGQRRSRVLRGQGVAHEEPLRGEERLPPAGEEIPPDCTVLAVGGPEKDLLARDDGGHPRLRPGGRQGARAWSSRAQGALPEPRGAPREWNLEAGQDVVVDVSGVGQIFGFSELAPLAMDYPWHPITKDFRLPTLYGGARSVEAGEGRSRASPPRTS